jgi:DNA-binding transcriptional regulator LsrR (DeoR family)
MVARRRLQRFVERDSDMEELANVVAAAREYAKGRPQQGIADDLNVSASTVSRWLSRADKDGILKTHVIPPRVIRLEEKLARTLEEKGVKTISIVPNGPDKNIDNLGYAGACQVMDAIAAPVMWHHSLSCNRKSYPAS